MATITFEEICRTTSAELIEMAEAGQLQNSFTPAGLYDSLIDPANADLADIQQVLAQGGMKNKVVLRYTQPTSEAAILDSTSSVCSGGVETNYVFDTVEADQVSATPVYLFDDAQMREICESGSAFRQRVFLQAENALRRDINSKLITLFISGAGLLDGDNDKAYTFLYQEGAITTALDDGMIELQTDLMDTGMTGTPRIVTGGVMYQWLQKQGIACCNMNGFDISQMGDIAAFYDNQIAAALPSKPNTFLAYAPGAAIFLGTDQNIGEFRKVVEGVYLHDVYVSPVTGETYDVNAHYDDCERKWRFQMSKRFGLWQLPKNLYPSGDPRANVNWNFTPQAVKQVAS